MEIVTKVVNGVVYCAGGNNGSSPGSCAGERAASYVGAVDCYLRPNYSGSSTTYPAYINVDVVAGTSNTPSKFSWPKSEGATNYYLRIWNSDGTKEVVSVWGTDGKTSWELQLDAGSYNAQVCAVNGDYVTNSAFKAFTVTYDPAPAYINVNVTAGTSNTPSKFSWSKSKGANNYYLRIWDSTGKKEIVSVWGTDGKLSWDLQLDAGSYNAQVCAVNGEYVTNSAFKSFTVVTHNHSYSSWTTTKAETCTSDGSKKRTCSTCGEIETQTISKTGHKYTSKVVDPTCTSKGYTLHTCSVCSDSYKDNETGATGHKFGDWTTVKEATCADNGSKIRTCSDCGHKETASIAKTNHEYVKEVIRPTATTKGYTIYTCSVCGYNYKGNEVSADGSLSLTSAKGSPGETVTLDVIVNYNGYFDGIMIPLKWNDNRLLANKISPKPTASDFGKGYASMVFIGRKDSVLN